MAAAALSAKGRLCGWVDDRVGGSSSRKSRSLSPPADSSMHSALAPPAHQLVSCSALLLDAALGTESPRPLALSASPPSVLLSTRSAATGSALSSLGLTPRQAVPTQPDLAVLRLCFPCATHAPDSTIHHARSPSSDASRAHVRTPPDRVPRPARLAPCVSPTALGRTPARRQVAREPAPPRRRPLALVRLVPRGARRVQQRFRRPRLLQRGRADGPREEAARAHQARVPRAEGVPLLGQARRVRQVGTAAWSGMGAESR